MSRRIQNSTRPSAASHSSSPGTSQGNSATRSGQMTAVMRAVSQSGPKVLRIGVSRGAEIIEERIIKDLTSVTVGTNDDCDFLLVGKEQPGSLTLFERSGDEYVLNFLEGNSGKVSLPTGISSLAQLKGQSKRGSDGSYRVKLSEDCRGKIIIGDTGFLFQFVAPPLIQPKAHLPASVLHGGSGLDWQTTIIVAFSFLLHFIALGLVYSDWADAPYEYDVDIKTLIEQIDRLPTAPPVEEKQEIVEDEKPTEEKAPEDKPKAPDAKPAPAAADSAPKPAMNQAQKAPLSNSLAEMQVTMLAALSTNGTATAGVLSGEVPTASLDRAAASDAAVSTSGGLAVAGGGSIRPGSAGGNDLANIGSASKTEGSTGSGTVAKVEGPKGNASVGAASVAGGSVSNAASVVARLQGRFRACYMQGLASNPDLSGRISLSIQVGPTGSVTSVSASPSGNITPDVVECVRSRAMSARFDPPQGGSAVVSAPVSFVKQ